VSQRCIELRGVEVHNLKQIDLDLPHRKLTVLCGVSGSGKTSLAIDTLYAEGQRRFIESFSAYTRQYLQRLERPACERIDGLPPALAVLRTDPTRSGRATVGTVTETLDYLRLLYSRIGLTTCMRCQREVRAYPPEAIANWLSELAAQLSTERRLLLGFWRQRSEGETSAEMLSSLKEQGLARIIHGEKTHSLADFEPPKELERVLVLVDRLKSGSIGPSRVRESVETVYKLSEGRLIVGIERTPGEENSTAVQPIDEQLYELREFTRERKCPQCGVAYPALEPRNFSFTSPLGACPLCEGTGQRAEFDPELIIAETQKSLSQGAIAPLAAAAQREELEAFLASAKSANINLDLPFRTLTQSDQQKIFGGDAEIGFVGVIRLLESLEANAKSGGARSQLQRYRSLVNCRQCGGARLRPESLAVQLGGKNLAELCTLSLRDSLAWAEGLSLSAFEKEIARESLHQISRRLGYLCGVGLSYLTLDREMRTLSTGEAQRTALTSALGSSLVNMLYVLDEPTAGLHPRDSARLSECIGSLRDRGNTVVVVEHDETLLRLADQVVELGPAAGERGGQVTFQGDFEELLVPNASLTGEYLACRRGGGMPAKRRPPQRGWITLQGARGNNLQNLTVEFPLGLLCVVTGVSGSGKSSLVQETLYGALCKRKRKDCDKPLPYSEIVGDGQIDDVILVDQTPIGKSPRSSPVTYVKAFDAIRQVFAETLDARTHNYSAAHFSYNSAEGRCSHCEGDGHLAVDMQFLADVYMKCPQCHGARYRKEILDVRYRGVSIAGALEMTAREAFSFFRGQTKVQARLKPLLDVGLDYLRLGQPANTLSSGESQRLKLAMHLASAKQRRTLFLLDEPTTGLHFSDIVKLLDCFESLLQLGHSIILVEHNPQVMKAADYLIDLGPEAADKGGRVVAKGAPEEVAATAESITGAFLAQAFEADRLARLELDKYQSEEETEE
jgi:excinuclease ABC subunit A